MSYCAILRLLSFWISSYSALLLDVYTLHYPTLCSVHVYAVKNANIYVLFFVKMLKNKTNNKVIQLEMRSIYISQTPKKVFTAHDKICKKAMGLKWCKQEHRMLW